MPRRLIFAALALALFAALGLAVSHRPPTAFDLLAAGERARFPALALALTGAGRFPVYATLCAAALLLGVLRRAYLPAATILTGAVLATWQLGDLFKAFFGRARPDEYYGIHETSAAYASGHAALSLVAYGFVAYVVWHEPLPPWVRRAAAIAAGAWSLAIGWSRLSLGAHYPTDLLGGYLLGGAMLALATVLYDRVASRTRAVAPPAASPGAAARLP